MLCTSTNPPPANAHSCSRCTPDALCPLQMAMMSFKSMPGTKVASESDVNELLIAREAYELGCLISIGLEEIDGFERHFALVKSCYTDYATVLPASENQQQLQGLNLLGLLAQSKIAEFHTGVNPTPHFHPSRLRVCFLCPPPFCSPSNNPAHVLCFARLLSGTGPPCSLSLLLFLSSPTTVSLLRPFFFAHTSAQNWS